MSLSQPDGQMPQNAAAPTLELNAQYLRDLSFENPRAPESVVNQTGSPEVKIDVDVKARQLNPTIFESVLALKVEARHSGQVSFTVEIEYGAVVTIKNAPQEMIASLLLIETPRIIFPFVRATLAEAIRDGGFPPLLINPIDFGELQRRKAAALAQQGAAKAVPSGDVTIQ